MRVLDTHDMARVGDSANDQGVFCRCGGEQVASAQAKALFELLLRGDWQPYNVETFT